MIAGEFLPAYQEKLAPMLAHPSVKVLGHRNDVPELMRKSDILILPSIEEGFGLVIAEAMGSGCVPLASEACTEICSHMKTGLMHRVGDVEALTQHITMLHEDRALLERFRAAGLQNARSLRGLPPGGYSSTSIAKRLPPIGADAIPGTARLGRSSILLGAHLIAVDCPQNEVLSMNPTISVVIPTYNRADKVGKTIESVLTQTFSDLRSLWWMTARRMTPGRFSQKVYGSRIRYYFQPNQGASVARNRGIAEARGEWIAFLDSDDLWEKDKLEWQFKALERFGPQCGACYTDTRFYNHSETRTLFQMAEESYRHGEELGVNTEVFKLLVRPGGAGMVVCMSSSLARGADMVRKTGGFDSSCCIAKTANLCSGWLCSLGSVTSTVHSYGSTVRQRRLRHCGSELRMGQDGILSSGKSAPTGRPLAPERKRSNPGPKAHSRAVVLHT